MERGPGHDQNHDQDCDQRRRRHSPEAAVSRKRASKTKKKSEETAGSASRPGEQAAAEPVETSADPAKPKMRRKEYEAEMRLLHGELVAMQEWVKASGAKICIVFEGRDTAGKGGTIKRITERVSPRVFRVIALPAPTEREKS